MVVADALLAVIISPDFMIVVLLPAAFVTVSITV